MNGKYKSVESIINRLLVNPMMEDINESDLAQYVGDAMKLIGSPKGYEDKMCTINIKKYKGKLPDDLVYIVQTLYSDSLDQDQDHKDFRAMRYATDTLHSKYHEVGSPDFRQINEYTYSLNNHYIYTDQEEGQVKMMYKGLATDTKGFPLIPDNIKFEKAIEAYVKLQHYTVKWELGKLPDKVFQRADQEYTWYIGAAQTAGQLMSIDEAESFANAFSRLILKPLQHQEYFTNHGAQEYIKPNRI